MDVLHSNVMQQKKLDVMEIAWNCVGIFVPGMEERSLFWLG